MATRALARDELWEIATLQHGYVTAQQALARGIAREVVNKLVHRGTLERAAFGVYRFPKYPYTDTARYMLAVLWTRAPEAALSHETALDVYAISDIIADKIHVTVGKHRRLRRVGGERYEVHYADLGARQIGWWEEVPTVTVATAIAQCIEDGTPTYLLRQALERGREHGRITGAERDDLAARLAARDG
jgi:predicted transcriptional regulator of viral defense system